jgi:hypothetical protein
MLADAVYGYTIFGIFLFQIIMFGSFSLIFGKDLLTYACLIFILIELLYYAFKKVYDMMNISNIYTELS